MEAISGIVMLVLVVFGIVLVILAILMPFFVFRIRNEMIKLNEQVASAIKLLNTQSEQL